MNEIKNIQERNARVEADKAWEVSWTRRLVITLVTYFIACSYMASLGIEKFYFHGAVPAGGYFLSTLSLSAFKLYWIKNVYKVQEVSHDGY